MREIVLVPTYHREELLYCCLKRIRQADPRMAIAIFPDRCSESGLLLGIADQFDARVIFVPNHDYFGNTYNTMEAFRFAYNAGFTHVYYVEDDVFVKPDFFTWHREMHAEFPNLFASMGWIFNRHAPITDDLLFQPWYYSIGTCFTREKLAKIVRHASPLYYADMAGYIRKEFKESALNGPFEIAHYEQDGLIQRVLDKDKTQTVCSGIAHCVHAGYGGYNRGWNPYVAMFRGCQNFYERTAKIEQCMADPYWRLATFGRDIVEREIGAEIPKRDIKYSIKLPGGWQSDFVSEMTRNLLPSRINSVPVPDEAIIECSQ